MADESMEGLARNEPRCAECIARPFDAKNPHAWKDYPSTEYDDYANAKHEAWDDGARVGFAAGRAALPDPRPGIAKVLREQAGCYEGGTFAHDAYVLAADFIDALVRADPAAALPDPPTDNPYRDEYGNHLPGEAGTAAGYDEGWAAREAAALPDAAKLLRYEAAACEARGHRDNAGCYRLGATFLERAAADREKPEAKGQRITHGRHCICTPCAAEDWTNPRLAPCGMHGSSCPREYAPLGAVGDTDPKGTP